MNLPPLSIIIFRSPKEMMSFQKYNLTPILQASSLTTRTLIQVMDKVVLNNKQNFVAKLRKKTGFGPFKTDAEVANPEFWSREHTPRGGCSLQTILHTL